MAVLISEWLQFIEEQDKSGRKENDWDCEVCERKKLKNIRNCDGKGQDAKLKFFDQNFEQCPLAQVPDEIFELLSIINNCEGGGFGNSRISPLQYLEETAFYVNVRGIVLREQMRIQRWKDKAEKGKANG